VIEFPTTNGKREFPLMESNFSWNSMKDLIFQETEKGENNEADVHVVLINSLIPIYLASAHTIIKQQTLSAHIFGAVVTSS
jgi:hypothetical protein